MDELSQPRPFVEPAGPETPPSVVGDLRMHEFPSRLFRNRRQLRVWVPPGYDLPENAGQRYPVFYLNDGQNLFDRATSFTGVEWEVDDTADRLIRAGAIPPTIFVGIDHARAERLKEYIPYRSLNPLLLRPLGDRYPAFLTQEVMPFIQQAYRTAKARRTRCWADRPWGDSSRCTRSWPSPAFSEALCWRAHRYGWPTGRS